MVHFKSCWWFHRAQDKQLPNLNAFKTKTEDSKATTATTTAAAWSKTPFKSCRCHRVKDMQLPNLNVSRTKREDNRATTTAAAATAWHVSSHVDDSIELKTSSCLTLMHLQQKERTIGLRKQQQELGAQALLSHVEDSTGLRACNHLPLTHASRTKTEDNRATTTKKNNNR